MSLASPGDKQKTEIEGGILQKKVLSKSLTFLHWKFVDPFAVEMEQKETKPTKDEEISKFVGGFDIEAA